MARFLRILTALASLAILTTASPVTSSKGYFVVDLQRTENRGAYLAKFAIGNPPQYQSLKVDTGSPTYSFLNPRNSICQESDHPCTYGTYDNLTSKTAQYKGSGFSDLLIDHGVGSFIQDSVAIGGVTLNGTFGYIDEYAGLPDEVAKPTTTILGLAQSCAFAVGPNCTVDGTSWIQQLYNASIINRRAISLYLGPDGKAGFQNAGSQLLVGGAVDSAKQGSKPFKVKMVDPKLEIANSQSDTINVTAMAVVYANGSRTASMTLGKPGVGLPSLVDSGSPLWYLPEAIWNVTYPWLGSPKTPAQDVDYYTVDCALAQKSNSPVIEVTFPGSKTNKINVPFSSLITYITNSTCGAFVDNGGPPDEDGLAALGDPFLRSVYITYDFQDLTFTISQAKYTSQSKIVAYP